MTGGRVQIINVMAVSLDGRIASHPGETDRARRAVGFTDDVDRAHLKALLEDVDAVVVGKSSLVASGGAWELPGRGGRPPVWAVLTAAGLPPDHRFYGQTRVERWLVSPAPLALPPGSSVRNLVSGARPAARVVSEALKAAGRERVLLFGGAAVNHGFYAEGLVDQLIVTICPLIIGKSAAVPLVQPELPAPVRLKLVASQARGDLVFLTYNVQKS
jgi:5-amino-6-(5-phosphoribosylamino)uracil reductase